MPQPPGTPFAITLASWTGGFALVVSTLRFLSVDHTMMANSGGWPTVIGCGLIAFSGAVAMTAAAFASRPCRPPPPPPRD